MVVTEVGPTISANSSAVQSEPFGITFEAVSVDFGTNVRAVDNVTLSVASGEFVSIVGPSGCGKTTLLNLAAGLLDKRFVKGAVSVANRPPSIGDRDVAYMLARDALCPWRSALANAELGAEIRGVPPALRRRRARQLLASVGLQGFEGASPKGLSHGMRQRVAIARTFCLDSRILLMDEPFGALDAQTKLQLEDVLLSLWQTERRTVLFITHDLSEAVSMSDRVIVMSARPGRIVDDIPITLGRPRSVRALQCDPTYHELYAKVWTTLEQGLGT
jgi:NitT/TauT family transport system ATP-binding protein